MLVVLDCGSQYTQLIRRAFDELGVRTKIVEGDLPVEKVLDCLGSTPITGVVISGSATSATGDMVPVDRTWLRQNVPILGICFGCQWVAQHFDSVVSVVDQGFAGESLQVCGEGPLISLSADGTTVWMSHHDSIRMLGSELVPTAYTRQLNVAAFQHRSRPIFGLQFHPEVTHTEAGVDILRAFAQLCGAQTEVTPWSAEDYVQASAAGLQQTVRGERVLVALSGGVDSSTLCVLLSRALGSNQLVGVYVDSGLMDDLAERQVLALCQSLGIEFVRQDAAERFFADLEGVTDPSEKCLVVGHRFALELAAVADSSSCRFVAQGTIWSDVIESGGTKFSSQIKPHHNVAGMPQNRPFKLIEPLRQLFKDQVRQLAKYLGLSHEYSERRVFPGPGFAIRVQGVVTREKVAIVRHATKIVEDVVEQSGLGGSIWMAFAILLDVRSLGVKGDGRVMNDSALAVRIVESTNSMTAQYSRAAYVILETISARILRETSVGRVVYDITDKPPGTIEWE